MKAKLSEEQKIMKDMQRRRHSMHRIRLPGADILSRERTPPTALSPLLEAEAQTCYSLKAALDSGNRRWIVTARKRWLEAHELTHRVMDEEAA
jgi:hypothetical protein